MQSKYKVNLLRLYLLLAALFPTLMIPTAQAPSEGWLLGLAAAWLGISAALVEFNHRRPPMIPWQLLPSLLLGALIWTFAERYAFWLWAWAALIMLPQPGWMTALNTLLAMLSWAWVARLLPVEQAVASGLVLALLLALGLIRARRLAPLYQQARERGSLAPGRRLWPQTRLTGDLVRESTRARRDGTHTELLLLRTRRRHLWRVAGQLCDMTQRFEHCYRLDSHTLGAILICRDADQAQTRRESLMRHLDGIVRVRLVTLPSTRSIALERQALDRQEQPFTTTRGATTDVDV
ncbi:MAG: hypothetical protein HLX48_01215 [Halomonas sp.]|uniref:hypothetical protein n=1 Tax=Halomonas sp. TaxID=1486246 RepID=UPI0017C451E8|nr:hypothetical protein [Halomonas sp.]NWN81603.1 hypothetical protein [Halomonas sp.]